ncbi:MAG: hypothetical protein LBD01_01595 [Puniceicoccales bacterium]|jgi:ABC-type phosphate transport system substrate-binding protein|nr:hypothetical protein [Puniceicoccales bacterium]
MILRLLSLVLFTLGCAAQAWGQAAGAVKSITLAGSDLLQGGAAENLKKNAASLPGGVEFVFDGSLHGERRLREGSADAALLIIPQKAKVRELLSGEWVARPVAYQTVVVIINEMNKLETIDLPSLAAIYGRGQKESYRNWAQLSDSKMDSVIFALSTHYDLGIVAPLFRDKVMGGVDFQEEVAFRASDTIAEEQVLMHTNAIAILATRPTHPRAKILALRAPGKKNAYLPTAENLHNGDYPLAVPMCFVFAKKNSKAAMGLLPLIFGDEFARALPSVGLMPIPENLRANIIRDAASTDPAPGAAILGSPK